jgi:hypothetical protein
VGLGYYAADGGADMVPMAGAVVLLWIGGLLAMIGGSYMLGPALGKPKGRKRIVVLSLLLLVLAAAQVGVRWLEQPTPLTSLEAGFPAAFAADAQHYQDLDRSLAQSVARFEALAAFQATNGEPTPLAAAEEAEAVLAWQTFFHTAFRLDRIRAFYEDYPRFDLGRRQRDAHLRSFLLTFAAELALYERTQAMGELLAINPNGAKLLDAPRAEHSLPGGTVAFVREELAGLTDLSRVVAGESYLRTLALTYGAEEAARAGGYHWLWQRVEGHLAAIKARWGGDVGDVGLQTVANDLAPLKRKLKGVVFPVQKGVADFMGDTRVQRPGRYLIGEEVLGPARGQLQPGDVLLARKNWYLSNLGLPGFWPHAMLYVGTDAQMAAAFDEDPEVLAWVKREGGKAQTFTAFMQERYPQAWRERVAHELDPHGKADPLSIVEAVGEGVLQSSLGHSAGDYLSATRPRLPAWVKARAIARAFGYLGRPYDFDFDFATDHALVCSELVWRSYRPLEGADDPGLRIDTVKIAGRWTLPANEFARLYRDEKGKGGAQLDFVLFIEGREKEQDAVARDEVAFTDSVDRSKWDVLQR